MILLLLIIVTCGCIFYAFKIEPYRVTLNSHTLNVAQSGREHLKVIQFSDLHIKEDFTQENLAKVVKKINEQDADIVIFTGDLYDDYSKYSDDEHIIDQLAAIEANYEKIAIWGNRDWGGGAANAYGSIMEESGFTLLRNENWYVTLENGRQVLFTGLDDALLGNPYMPDDTKTYDADYEILLSHEPDNVDNYMGYAYDIALSGHSHGGQINIPFLPFVNEMALAATALSSKYSGGMYDFDGEKLKQLYVNTGIGTTHISARFGVVPEITLFHIYV